MKFVVCFSLIAFCFATTNVAQKIRKPTVQKTVIISQFAEAEKAWVPFWTQFRTIVQNEDHRGLYNLMVEDFNYNACDLDDGRDEEIKKFMPGSVCSGWEDLKSLIFGKVSVVQKLKLYRQGADRIYDIPSKTVSDKLRSRPCAAENTSWYGVFKYSQGSWSFVELMNCEHGE